MCQACIFLPECMVIHARVHLLLNECELFSRNWTYATEPINHKMQTEARINLLPMKSGAKAAASVPDRTRTSGLFGGDAVQNKAVLKCDCSRLWDGFLISISSFSGLLVQQRRRDVETNIGCKSKWQRGKLHLHWNTFLMACCVEITATQAAHENLWLPFLLWVFHRN